MSSNVPWGEGKHFKTESEYMVWLRGALRRSWMKYPPQNIFKQNRTKKIPLKDEKGNVLKYKSGKKKGKTRYRTECKCDGCGEMFPSSKVQVDHIESAGTLLQMDHLKQFVTNLYCDESNFQLLCKECHEDKTYSDRYGVSIEQARQLRKVIKACKQKPAIQKKFLIEQGFKEEEVSNAKKRRMCYEKYYGVEP